MMLHVFTQTTTKDIDKMLWTKRLIQWIVFVWLVTTTTTILVLMLLTLILSLILKKFDTLSRFDKVELERKKKSTFVEVLSTDLLSLVTVYTYTALSLSRIIESDRFEWTFLLTTSRQPRWLLTLTTSTVWQLRVILSVLHTTHLRFDTTSRIFL